jgi:hypothetical protein
MKSPKPEVRSQKSEINLHIEELVLHGFAPRDRHGIREAVEAELMRLISEQPFFSNLPKNISRERVDGGSFRLALPAKPAAVGAQIAKAVHGGIHL